MEAEGRDTGASSGGVRGDPGERVAVGKGAGCRRGRGPGPGPQGPAAGLEADPGVVARIRELDGQGLGKAGIAVAAGVSESSVRSVLRPAGAGGDDGPGGGAAGPADPV